MTESKDALSRLFERYRACCPDPEASPGFVPGLWQRIEERRSFAWKLRYYARGLVTVAAAICLAVGVFGSAFDASVDPVYTQNYVETLEAAASPENLAYADVIRTDYPGSSEAR